LTPLNRGRGIVVGGRSFPPLEFALAFPVRRPNDPRVPRPSQSASRLSALPLGQSPLTGLLPEPTRTNPCQTVLSDDALGVWLYQGNSLELLDVVAARFPDGIFDMIFADPPYFLSNGGITCHAGRMVKVDKGNWDKSRGPELNHEFNREWLRRCQRVLKPNGTIWVSGTQHVIFSVGYALQQLGFKLLNDITWEKPNPPPNLSCRYFTHSTETLLWAAKRATSRHYFNYQSMGQIAGGKQMKSVWRIATPRAEEKRFGKHPTQKPLGLVERCLLAASKEGDLILDPFVGGGTTVVAAMEHRRRCVGVELDEANLKIAGRRLDHARNLFLHARSSEKSSCPDERSRSPMVTS